MVVDFKDLLVDSNDVLYVQNVKGEKFSSYRPPSHRTKALDDNALRRGRKGADDRAGFRGRLCCAGRLATGATDRDTAGTRTLDARIPAPPA